MGRRGGVCCRCWACEGVSLQEEACIRKRREKGRGRKILLLQKEKKKKEKEKEESCGPEKKGK